MNKLKVLLARKFLVMAIASVAGWIAMRMNLPRETLQEVLAAIMALAFFYAGQNVLLDAVKPKDFPKERQALPQWLWQKFTDSGFLFTVVAQVSVVVAVKLNMEVEILREFLWSVILLGAAVAGLKVSRELGRDAKI